MTSTQTEYTALDPSCPDDPEREARLRRFAVLDYGLHNESGPMMVVDGIGHDVEQLLAFVTEDDALGGWLPTAEDGQPIIRIEPGNWGYSPRIKHCDRYTGGWGCDSEGDWHRHFVDNAKHGRPLTLVGLELYADIDAPAEYLAWWQAAYGPQTA
jgi:hypothetical protein